MIRVASKTGPASSLTVFRVGQTRICMSASPARFLRTIFDTTTGHHSRVELLVAFLTEHGHGAAPPRRRGRRADGSEGATSVSTTSIPARECAASVRTLEASDRRRLYRLGDRGGARDERVASHDRLPRAGDWRAHEDHAKATDGWPGSTWRGRANPTITCRSLYSDLFDLSYEAVGALDPRHTTVVEWEEPNRKGVVYDLDAARQPRDVLLWNVFGRVEPARDLIGAHRSIEMGTLRGPVR